MSASLCASRRAVPGVLRRRGRGPDARIASTRDRGAGSEARHPRKLSGNKPAERPLTTDEGWREAFAGEVRGALAEMAAGEIPASPRDEALCDSCAFRITCPLHLEDEPWSG